jgi:hypothetical protein
VNAVRLVALMFGCLMAVATAHCASPVTIAQLEQFLNPKQTAKESDDEVAARLNQVTLAEQLSGTALARVLAEVGSRSRPKTAEQIELLAAESVFQAPPVGEQPREPAPDAAAQQRMIDAAQTYVNAALLHLPDFLAVRVTRSFDNLINDPKPKHGKPEAQMHFVSEKRREMAYRGGREVAETAHGRASEQASGMSTWGEFGGILKIVLNDAFSGNVAWERWQRNEEGTLVAVFRYSIPEASSHYSIDFCCYVPSMENPVELSFHAKPGYHGELFIDAQDGSIARVTVEAELKERDPVVTSAMEVEYGGVEIGGKEFICPVRGVAITETLNLQMKSIDDIGLERRTNLVKFVDYHRFGSTIHILPE